MYQDFGIGHSKWRYNWTHRWEDTSATHHYFKQCSICTLGSDYPSNSCASSKYICISSFSWSLHWNRNRMDLFVYSHSIIKAMWVAHHLAGVSWKAKSKTKILWSVVIFSSMLVRKLSTSKVPSYVGCSLTSVPIHIVSLTFARHLENHSYEPFCKLSNANFESSSIDCMLLQLIDPYAVGFM